jgi:RNA 3'-terminal phosphate cyclase (ATP)
MHPRPSREPPELLELDGRTLEGGGQLIRVAIGLAALASIPVHVRNIRGNRAGGGGLKAQHLAGVRWLAHACGAELRGAEKGSKALTFIPGAAAAGSRVFTTKQQLGQDGRERYECRLDIGTAGSTGLALQAILPFILFSRPPAPPLPIHLRISGGTNVSASPSYEYIAHVLVPTLARIGFPGITASLDARGWSHGPTSIGSFSLEIPHGAAHLPLPAFHDRRHASAPHPPKPSHLRAIFLAPTACHAPFRAALLPLLTSHFGDTFTADAASLSLTCEDSKHAKRFYFILIATVPSPSTAGARDECYTLARDWLYDRKISDPETVLTSMAARVTRELTNEWKSGAWVDEHMRDQLVIFQALAQGRSEVCPGQHLDADGAPVSGTRPPSLHTQTAQWVAEQLLGVAFDSQGVCTGIGFGESGGGDGDLLANELVDLRVAST